MEVKVAVTGNTGVGKSSFINALRGLNADDKGAAEVNVKEGTAFPTKYVHPDNPKIALWDLPGVGCLAFPKETYLQKIGFNDYDIFIIICAGRFTENDLWLAKSVRSLGKKFYFVRTKVHQDFENQMRCRPTTYRSKELVRDEVYNDCMGILRAEGFGETKVFIIDNYVPEEYDFQFLLESIMKELPAEKNEAMTDTIYYSTEGLILKRKEQIQKRIWFVSIGATAAGTVPVPGFCTGVDIAIIIGEIKHYKKVFRLDDISLEKAAKALKTTKSKLIRKLNIDVDLLTATTSSVISFCTTLGAAGAAKTATKIVLPIIGSVIGMSYGTTVFTLRSILDLFVQYSLNIGEALRKKTI